MALIRDGPESLLKDITLGCIHKIILSMGGIGKHFNTDIPTVAIPGGSAMMIKYVFV